MFATLDMQRHTIETVTANCQATSASHASMLACSMQVCASIRAQQIGRSQPLPPQSPSGSLRALSQRRAYMDSGWLAQDQAVIAYMKKLELLKYASVIFGVLHGLTQTGSDMLHRHCAACCRHSKHRTHQVSTCDLTSTNMCHCGLDLLCLQCHLPCCPTHHRSASKRHAC